MKTIQTIDRAINIIEYISKNQNCRLIDMCNYFNLNKSTLHGILSTLEYHGFINKDSKNATYKLGAKLFELGKIYEENLSIKKVAKPYIVKLAQKFSETVHIAVLNESRVLYVDKEESVHSLRMASKVGTTDPILTTAIGKAIISTLPENKLNILLDSIELDEEEKKVVDLERIKKELEIIGEKGYALDLEELEAGLNCIAVPIRNGIGEAIAAISISIPSSRLTKEKLNTMKDELLKVSREISDEL